jgi:hypothetical protein
MSRHSRRPNWKYRIGEQFIAHRVRMIESPAWRALSYAARRVLDRLEIENAHHGGNDNGRLPCTYSDFHRFGIRRRTIARAIKETVWLGFVDVTEKGRAAPEDFGRPNLFRLTYLPTKSAGPTDEWQKITSEEMARERLIGLRCQLAGEREMRRRQDGIEIDPTSCLR